MDTMRVPIRCLLTIFKRHMGVGVLSMMSASAFRRAR